MLKNAAPPDVAHFSHRALRMVSENAQNTSAARVLSSLSMTSGALLLCAPRTVAELYNLPGDARFGRVLGARDLAIGLLLRRPSSAGLGMWLRAGADAFDATVRQREQRNNPPQAAQDDRAGVAGALALVVLSVNGALEKVRGSPDPHRR